MITMPFPDTVTILPSSGDSDYGKETLGEGVEVSAAVEQSVSYAHSNSMDFRTADLLLFLRPGESVVTSAGYRIEGYVVLINLFGAAEADSYYKVTACEPVRDTLLGNQLKHVECALKKIEDPT